MRRTVSGLVVAAGVLLSCCDALGAPVPSVDEILQRERQIIESRKAIQSGRVAVRTRLTKCDRDPTRENAELKYVSYFQGDKVRCDQGTPGHLYQAVFAPDVTIHANEKEASVLVLGPQAPQAPPKAARFLPDPRRLGAVVWFYDTISNHGYEEIFLRPNRDQFKIEAGDCGGEQVWKVTFRISGARGTAIGEYWLSDGKGGLPVYIAMSAGEGDKQTSKSVTTKLKEYGSNHVWFPSEVVFRMTEGSKVTAEQRITVESAVFGEPIPEETFSLRGLGLPIGRSIDLDGHLWFWDGEKPVQSIQPDP